MNCELTEFLHAMLLLGSDIQIRACSLKPTLNSLADRNSGRVSIRCSEPARSTKVTEPSAPVNRVAPC